MVERDKQNSGSGFAEASTEHENVCACIYVVDARVPVYGCLHMLLSVCGS